MKRLRELRKIQRISMRDFGKIFGLAESTISLYETGKRQPDNETLINPAKYFNVSTDYLLGNEENKKPVLTEKDEYDIKNKIDELLDMMSHKKDSCLTAPHNAGIPGKHQKCNYVRNGRSNAEK